MYSPINIFLWPLLAAKNSRLKHHSFRRTILRAVLRFRFKNQILCDLHFADVALMECSDFMQQLRSFKPQSLGCAVARRKSSTTLIFPLPPQACSGKYFYSRRRQDLELVHFSSFSNRRATFSRTETNATDVVDFCKSAYAWDEATGGFARLGLRAIIRAKLSRRRIRIANVDFTSETLFATKNAIKRENDNWHAFLKSSSARRDEFLREWQMKK